MQTKPILSVRITGIYDDIGENNEGVVFDKSNGLTFVSIEWGQEQSPYYGIISKSGELHIIDGEDKIKKMSDDNILPDINVDIYIDGIVVASFIASNDISYSKLTKEVTINLTDRIEDLQDRAIKFEQFYENSDMYTIADKIFKMLDISVSIDSGTINFLRDIKVTTPIVVPSGTAWDIIDNLAKGTKCWFHRENSGYILEKVGF